MITKMEAENAWERVREIEADIRSIERYGEAGSMDVLPGFEWMLGPNYPQAPESVTLGGVTL